MRCGNSNQLPYWQMILKDGVNTGAISVVIPLGSKDDTAGLFLYLSFQYEPTKKQQLHGTRAQDPLPPPLNDISFKVMIYVKLVNYPKLHLLQHVWG